jgi:hypothetical protein
LGWGLRFRTLDFMLDRNAVALLEPAPGKIMTLEYENGTLRVVNAEGLRWQLTEVPKPSFTFDYDAVSLTEERALRRLGASIYPLALDEIREVTAFVERQQPPVWATYQNQMTSDLRALARGLINTVVTQLEYEGLLDVLITGREGSTDLYAEEARQVLSYVDSVWNAFYALAEQIKNTAAEDLQTLKEYAGMVPFPPPPDQFSGGLFQELMYDPHPDR